MSHSRRGPLRWLLAALLFSSAVRSARAEAPALPPRGQPAPSPVLSAIEVAEIPEQRLLALAAGDRLDDKDAGKLGELSLRLLGHALDRGLAVRGAPFVASRSPEGAGGYEVCVVLVLAAGDPDPKVGPSFSVRRRPPFLGASAVCSTAPSDASRCIERLLEELPALKVEQAGVPTLDPIDAKPGEGQLRFRVVIPVKRKPPPEPEPKNPGEKKS
jgi:hypothetical protein